MPAIRQEMEGDDTSISPMSDDDIDDLGGLDDSGSTPDASTNKFPDQNIDEAIKENKLKVAMSRRLMNGAAVGSGKRKRKRGKMNMEKFVKDTCYHLQEKKPALVKAAIQKLGLYFFQELIKEVDAIESCGGQFTIDGTRRRTPGGVLWNILKARVKPDVYKHIMSEGKAAEKEAKPIPKCRIAAAKPDAKRRLVKAYMPVAARNKAEEGEIISASLDSISASKHVQNAWIEGIKSRVSVDKLDSVKTQKGSGGESQESPKKVPVSERLRFPVQYDDVLDESGGGDSSKTECATLVPEVDTDQKMAMDESAQKFCEV